MELADGVHTPSVLSTTLSFAVRADDLLDKTVCDVGCGSGYLGLGLLLRGARHLHATDVSADALAATADTAERNDLTDRVTLHEGSLLDPVQDPVDLVISNPPSTARRIQPAGSSLNAARDGGELGDDLARAVIAAASKGLSRDGVLYLPTTSLANPGAVKESAARHFDEVSVVATHDILFPWYSLAIDPAIRQMHTDGHGYPVEHHGHPYWRVEILRCAQPSS